MKSYPAKCKSFQREIVQMGDNEGILRTKYRICIYSCYVAYMNVMRNKSISKQVRYKLKVSDKTKGCSNLLKDIRYNYKKM